MIRIIRKAIAFVLLALSLTLPLSSCSDPAFGATDHPEVYTENPEPSDLASDNDLASLVGPVLESTETDIEFYEDDVVVEGEVDSALEDTRVRAEVDEPENRPDESETYPESVMESEVEETATESETVYISESSPDAADAPPVTVWKPSAIEYSGTPSSARITMIGDMLMHIPVSNRAFTENGINYDYLFENTRDVFLSSDLAIVNNECIFGGNERGLQTYPCFNVFTELGDAEARAGFDVSLCATNHTMDQGVSGIRSALNHWNNSPIVAVGINNSPEEQNTVRYADRNGIRFAVLNFTYGMNGFKLPAGCEYMVDLMDESNRQHIADMIDDADKNADFVIVCPHWGNEYQCIHSAAQQAWAEFFTEHGADLILGAHSHCLQDAGWITAENGNTAFCYYSLGNYVSSQGYTYSLLGGIADVEVYKDEDGTRITKTGLIPTVTHYTEGYGETYVYKLSQYSDELAAAHGALTSSGQYQTTVGTLPLSMDTFNRILDGIGVREMTTN